MNMILSKWGHSLGVRIPQAMAKQAGLDVGTPVRISVRNGRIVVETVQYDLDRLVAGITPKNRHESIEDGVSMGREAW